MRPARPSTLDLALGAVFGGLNFVEVLLADGSQASSALLVLPTSIMIATGLVLRVAWPTAAVATFVVGYALQVAAVGHVDVVTIIAGWVTVMAFASYLQPLLPAMLAGGIGLLPILVFVAGDPARGVDDIGPGEVSLALIPWIGGRLVRASHHEAEAARTEAVRAEQQAEAAARSAAMEERERIARELHDIIAHALTTVVIQAEAGDTRLERGDPKVADSLAAIQRTARGALGEMRTVLSELRDEHEGAPSEFTDIDGIRRLIAEAPFEVDLQVGGDQDRVPATLQATAYRIVQEALTNVGKHSASRRANVQLDISQHALVITVTDEGPPLANGPPGHGLIGMRERAERFAGSLTTHRDGDGFTVRAVLPMAQP